MSGQMGALSLVAVAAALATAFGRAPVRLQSAPARQGGPSLQNGSFEGSFNPWQTWSVVQEGDCAYQEPEIIIFTIFGDDPLHVIEGHDAVRISIGGDRSYWAGLRQTVSGVTPGMRLEFSVEAQYDATTGANKSPSNLAGDANMRVGIDPTGGNSPTNPDIVWSPPENRQDAFYKVSVQAVARSDKVTVFISAHPSVCQENNRTFFDRAKLESLGIEQIPTDTPPPTATVAATAAPTAAPPTSTSAAPQATAAPLLTPTPAPDGSVLYTVQPGDTLTAIANAAGITVEELQALNGLTDSNIRIGQQLVLATADPTEPPTETPTETAPPATETPPPSPTPTATPFDPAGTLCVAMFEDADADGAHDADEPLLAGGTLRLLAGTDSRLLAEYETSGTGEPYCFERLTPATYLVAAAGPEGYALTKDEEIGVLLPPQGEMTVTFGARRQEGPNAGSLAAGGAIAAALLAAGGAAAYFWRRRRQTP